MVADDDDDVFMSARTYDGNLCVKQAWRKEDERTAQVGSSESTCSPCRSAAASIVGRGWDKVWVRLRLFREARKKGREGARGRKKRKRLPSRREKTKKKRDKRLDSATKTNDKMSGERIMCGSNFHVAHHDDTQTSTCLKPPEPPKPCTIFIYRGATLITTE